MPGRGDLRASRRLGAGSRCTARKAGGNDRGRSHGLSLASVLLAVLAVSFLLIPARASGQEGGATAYQQVCASCHQADGGGIPGAFPPLAGNPNITGPDYVIDVIRNGKQGPITVRGVEFNSVMPAITTLTDTQVEAVAAYVVGLAAGSAPPPTTLPPPSTGDASRGEDLFVGRATLAAGGSACVACHAAGPHGGASLGPDLTDVFTRLGGEAGLTGWLASPPSPTMQPIFGTRPLDQAEIVDVVAYLGSLPGTATDRGPDLMLIGGGVGLIVLFGAMALIFKRPRGRYVDQLRSKP